MKLYHYTSLESFLHIWRMQRLNFSAAHKKTNNDFFEKQKTFTIVGDYMSIKRNHWERFSENINKYWQVSLTRDFKDCYGCLSPMMWGQYADNGNGVCIELEYDNIRYSKELIWANRIVYKPLHPEIKIDAEIMKNSLLHDEFIIKHRDNIFFKKHKHWCNENEFRFISKECKFLDISNSVVAIHVPNQTGHTSYVVRRIVNDDSKVNYIKTIPVNGYLKLISIPYNGGIKDIRGL